MTAKGIQTTLLARNVGKLATMQDFANHVHRKIVISIKITIIVLAINQTEIIIIQIETLITAVITIRAATCETSQVTIQKKTRPTAKWQNRVLYALLKNMNRKIARNFYCSERF